MTFSKATSSACFSLSFCEKVSPSDRGLIESKLQRIEEFASATVSRGMSAIWCRVAASLWTES